MFKKFWGLFKGDEDTLPISNSPKVLTEKEKLDKHILILNKQFSQNLDLVSKSVPHIRKSLLNAISSSSIDEELTYTGLYTLLLGVWIEGRLHKLVYEEGAFNETDRQYIYSGKSIEEKWHKTLEVAFKKFRKIEINQELSSSTTSLGFTHFKIYSEMKVWITKYISPVATLRNKVAHGQWKFLFVSDKKAWKNSYNFTLNETLMKLYPYENYLTIERKFALIKAISLAINNMAVDATKYKTTEFDIAQEKIQEYVNELKSIDRQQFKAYKKNAQDGYKMKADSLRKKEETFIKKIKEEHIKELKTQFILTPK